MPRHDVPRSGVFEPEQVLAMKSLELFRQWRRRVRVKMQDQIQTAPWLCLVPGIAIVLTVLSLNVFGDGLRDALDPRAKVRLEH